MATDVLELVVRANLALAAAIALVLVARAPMRRWFGARVAYALWLVPLLAAAMCFAPPRTLVVSAPALGPPAPSPAATYQPAQTVAVHTPPQTPALQRAGEGAGAPSPADLIDPQFALLAIWIAVALVWLGILALRQQRFVASLGRLAPRRDWGARVFGAETRCAGPALIGVLRPRIVTPADFEERYTEEERWIMLAHERAHMRHGDPLINALAASLQCLCWFNPLVHAGVRALRIDQELACDEAVLASSNAARRSYAEALLKTQIARAPSPLACAWPPISLNALKERIVMLKRTLPSRSRTLLGVSALALVAAGACAAAWSAQPPRIVTAEMRAERDADAHPSAQSARREHDRTSMDDAHSAAAADAEHESDIENELDIEDEVDVENLANLENESEPPLLGAEGPVVDGEAIREQVERALAQAEHARGARRLTEEERRAIRAAVERARAASREAAEHGRLSDAERARIQAEVARARAEADRVRADVAHARREGQREAREAERTARAHARVAQADVAELSREARTLAARALELAALSVDGREPDQAALDAAEAALEASAERLGELVARIQTEARDEPH